MRAYVEDGVTGLLVRPGDQSAMASALARLLGDPLLADRLGTAARDRVAAEHSSAAYATGLAQVARAAGRRANT